ncbi:hypothetical protein ACHWQZ_G009869 [Mnemiopsis leidyi]
MVGVVVVGVVVVGVVVVGVVVVGVVVVGVVVVCVVAVGVVTPSTLFKSSRRRSFFNTDIIMVTTGLLHQSGLWSGLLMLVLHYLPASYHITLYRKEKTRHRQY